MKKMRTLMVVVAVAAVSMATAGCPGLDLTQIIQPPDVKIESVSISGVSQSGVDVLVKMEIDNPNPVQLDIAKVKYSFRMGGRDLATGTGAKGVKLKANGDTKADFYISFTFQDLLAVLQQNFGNRELPFRIKGTVYFDTPFGDLPVEYSDGGMIIVPQM